MKKNILFLICFFTIILNVKAECTYTDELALNSKAANVRNTYELVTETEEYEDGVSDNEYFLIKILNITEDTYIELSNDYNKDIKTYHYNQTNEGEIDIPWRDLDEIVNFTLTVYSEGGTPCPNTSLRTVKFSTPKLNEFYNRAVCENIPDFYLCQKYITVENVSEDIFVEKTDSFLEGLIDSEGEEIELSDKSGFLYFLNKYKFYIIGGVILIGGIGTAIYLKKTKRIRDLGI